MSLLEIRCLNKTYGNKNIQYPALRKISLNIERGEFVAVVGSSGSGKTTLLNAISGVDRAWEGEIIWKDKNIKNLSDNEMIILRRREIGVIYQFFNLISSLTVEENITLCVELDNRKVNRDQLVSIMKELEIIDKRKSFINELSGGEQQRVAIARALLCEPAILLADEPTGNLDSVNSQKIIAIFKKISEKYRQTILIVTHDKQAAQKADRVIQLEDGRIIDNEISM
ncbi:ABC transporter ATP-binding protein [[Clostridium] innocuum]|nr:ABC transporter ATP-binding protein [[Clostridium] innocuum]